MYKVSIQDGKACEKILRIEVVAERIRAEYDEFYKSVTPKAKIPGFRPGKAPREVVAIHYGGEARGSVLKRLITDSYHHALKEKSLEPLGLPEIDEIDFQDASLSYRARIEIRPKIKLSRITGLKAKREKVEVKAEDVENALKRLQESLAQYKAIEDRAAVMGDYVIADYQCYVDGREVDKRTDDWFEIREEEYLKGFSSQLVGSKPGEAREVRVRLPENFNRKELAGQEATFQVKIKEIKAKKLPPIDDELAKDAGEYKSLVELKEKVRQDIFNSKEREAEVRFERELLDELLKQNKIDLPEGLVKRRLEHLVSEAWEHYRQQGVPESQKPELSEKLYRDLAPEAQRQVHLAFILDEIAIRENVVVTQDDLKMKYQWIASHVRQPVEAVAQFYDASEEKREGLQDQIRNEKTIEYLKKNAKDR